VVIDNLHVIDAITLPSETDAPSIANADAMQSGPITFKGFQPVSWRRIQFIERGNRTAARAIEFLRPHMPVLKSALVCFSAKVLDHSVSIL
jgi:hypothetical protein